MEDENIDWRERWRERSRQMFDTSEAKKSFENVFDHSTWMSLLKLADRKVIRKLYGVMESGKESVVFLAETPDDEIVVVKIYMNQSGSFRQMKQYLQGDKRFRNVKNDRKSIIEEWCRKEFSNLEKASKVVNCPEPITAHKNILVMEFIGKDMRAYPKLKEVKVDNPEEAYQNELNKIKKLWEEEEMVHGDLSEYNILVEENTPVWIDFSQGVHKSHPEAVSLGKRDVKNVGKFFIKQGADINPEKDAEAIFQDKDALN